MPITPLALPAHIKISSIQHEMLISSAYFQFVTWELMQFSAFILQQIECEEVEKTLAKFH